MPKTTFEDAYRHHTPFGSQPIRYDIIRATGRNLAQTIVLNTPPSREQSLALTAVQEAVMWANAAVAIHEAQPAQPPPSDVETDNVRELQERA